jgi:peptidoglycan hydrolase-like protein with peptidoglycan-binding domain
MDRMANLTWPVLKKGDQGDDVAAAQFLIWCAGRELDPDGEFGQHTEDGVKWFQQKAQLTPDGVIGEKTWTKMTDGRTVPGSTVKRGSTGHCVGAAQVELRKHGLYQGKIDGDFGTHTQDAVRTFQGKVGIAVDGVVGPVTWQNMICRGHI